jgi:hypothetical protein
MPYKKMDPKTLLLSFPSIQIAAKSFPIPDEAYTDARGLHSWAQNADISMAATHVVNLVASVIDGTGFSGDARFDLLRRLRCGTNSTEKHSRTGSRKLLLDGYRFTHIR